MEFRIVTDHPVAVNSVDHLYPLGTANDNSINPAFNRKLYTLFPGRQLAVLDFGCAGGGMVRSMLEDGHVAVGLEGSDYSLLRRRAEWGVIPDYLFTCDVIQPFSLYYGNVFPFQFDVITAWEFLEHIEESDLPGVIENMRRHLKPGGLVIGSINDNSSAWDGIEHHRTRKPFEWWIELFDRRGFERQPGLEQHFGSDWVRAERWNFVFEEAHG